MRLIDVEGAVYELKILLEDYKHEENSGFIEMCIDVIESRPTVDTEPVVYGHWIPQNTGRTLFACSNCHKGNYGGHERHCPNCGAYMSNK